MERFAQGDVIAVWMEDCSVTYGDVTRVAASGVEYITRGERISGSFDHDFGARRVRNLTREDREELAE